MKTTDSDCQPFHFLYLRERTVLSVFLTLYVQSILPHTGN